MSTAPRTPSPDGCPVDHSKMSRARGGQSPLLAAPPAAPAALVCDSTALDTPPRPATHPILPPSSAGQCPVDHTKFARPAASSSSSSSAGPALAGPAIVGDHFPDATPQPNQRGKLSTAAVASTIPKGGADQPADATWVFPSPQRFFNAMAKKGWNPKEPDMQWVVSIHNTVNEATWRKVLEFEQMHADECAQPKLVRFKGRPSDLSPKARILGWMGSDQERRRTHPGVRMALR